MSDDDSWSAEITRRRVLGGILTVGAASSAAGAGTMALFSDTEQSTGNSVQAGTLDLTVDGDPSNAVLHVEDAKPGQSDTQATTIRNDGTLPGYLTFGIAGFQTPENGVNSPESDATREDDPLGPSTGGDHTGELAQSLRVRMKLIVDDETHYLVGTADDYRLAANVRLGEYDLSSASGVEDLALDSEQEVQFETDYRIPETVTNEIQSDSVVIDAVFALTQEREQTIVPEVREVDAEEIGPNGDGGVRFDVTNNLGEEMTINALHVQTEGTDISWLSSKTGGAGYRDGNYGFGADAYIDADTDGWVDSGRGAFEIPGWIDLSADGGSEGNDQEAILAADDTATISLYAFRPTYDGYLVDMTGQNVSVRVTLDVTLADGTETFVPLTMTPE